MAKKFAKKAAPAKKSAHAKKQPAKKAYVQKECHGALFKNEDKESDKHPDYKGSYTDANGEKHWVSAWVNEAQSGKKYISFITQEANLEESEETEEDEDSDEMPF